MARARLISRRLVERLRRADVHVLTPTPREWRDLPLAPAARCGWLPPVRLTPTTGWLIAFCPELIDAATDDLDTGDLDRFLDTLALPWEAAIRFPGLDAAVVTRRVDAHIATAVPGGRDLHARVTTAALALADARPRPPRSHTPPQDRIDALTHLGAIIADHVGVELVALRDGARCPGGFQRMDLRKHRFAVDADRLAAWSAPLDDRQHDRWLSAAAVCAHGAGIQHRYATDRLRVVTALVTETPDEALFTSLLAARAGLSLAEFIGEHH
jgi:hypothetical protein